MQNIDTFKFCIGALWICMGIIGLFGRRISWLRRVIFMLMSGFYAAVVFAGAFHSDFSAMTGISAPTVFIIIMLLPSILILLGIWDGYFKSKHDPDA